MYSLHTNVEFYKEAFQLIFNLVEAFVFNLLYERKPNRDPQHPCYDVKVKETNASLH